MKISIIGTHGIGKTTLAYQIATEAKRRRKNAIVINEVARRCPFPLNDDFTTDGAEWIITSQINRELQAKAEKYDFIVCDRSAYDPICYLKASNKPINNFHKLEMYAEEWIKTYDRVYFVTPSGETPVDDGVRSTDVEFQKRVHDEFFSFYLGIFHCIKDIKIEKVCSKDIFDGNVQKIYGEIF